MKKVLLTIALLVTFLIPTIAQAAETKTYKTMNLDEALTQEEITHDFSNYKESDKQITIYLFRGYGCGYCHRFLEFLNSIVADYGKYFKLVSYEVWYDKDNSDLMQKVSTFLGQPAQGVPYIIIGDKVFGGYSNKYDEDIKKAIKELYESDNRYDVFEEMKKAEESKGKEESKNSSSSNCDTWLIIGITGGLTLVCTIVAIVVILINSNEKSKLLLEKINKLEKEKSKVEVIKEEKKDAIVVTEKTSEKPKKTSTTKAKKTTKK